MARTEAQLDSNEVALLVALDNLAISGAAEAIRKTGATTLANVSISGGVTFITGEVPTGAIDGSNKTFTLANTPTSGSVKLFHNGLRLRSGAGNDYTVSTATITMSYAPETSDSLEADYYY